jgi:aryl-alcohol dehydrogenase-like predicted oxidoreductase
VRVRASHACRTSLAKRFLTGKYRPDATVKSARAQGARAYLDARGQRVLAALDEIAVAHHTPVAAVSLAWLLDRPTIAAPIASARTVAQLGELIQMATTKLTPDETRRRDDASRVWTAHATPKPDQNRINR